MVKIKLIVACSAQTSSYVYRICYASLPHQVLVFLLRA